MSQLLQTNGDYTIKTADTGTIKLDTGAGVGVVRVTGNLIVEGDTQTISAENLTVADNIIELNFGETGAGVSLRYSGLQIDRGTETPASIVYDENDDTYIFAKGTPESSFNYSESAIRTKTIKTNADTDGGDLTLIGNGTGVVKVTGTLNYELQITDDDDIPNKKYVDDSIRDNPTFQIVDDDTRFIVTDTDVAGSEAFLAGVGFSTFGESGLTAIVDGTLTAQFFANRAEIQDIEINGAEITTKGLTNDNIFIRTQGTGKLQTNYALQLEKIGVTPASVADSVLINAGPTGLGDSGVFFVNSAKNDELVSRNRALLLSMIF